MIDADVHECWACVHNNCGCDTWCEYGEAFELREDVKNAPTIKAVLVAHGEWIKIDGDWKNQTTGESVTVHQCSRCGNYFLSAPYNFCPHCGADMRKKV